jgi:hypothetical protein
VRALWLLAVGLVLPLAGCAHPDPCHDTPDGRAVVQALSGRDAHVLLASGEPAVLHLPEQVWFDEAGECSRIGPEGLRVGDRLAFGVDAWAESYPMQGWPKDVVALR